MTSATISSIEKNSIKDYKKLLSFPTDMRVLDCSGIKFQVTITKNYISVTTLKENKWLAEKLKDFPVFQNLQEFVFNSCEVYGVFREDLIYIYDIFINDNYMSFKDMVKMKDMLDIPLLEPIYIGKDVIPFISNEDYCVFPVVYVDDKRKTEESLNSEEVVIFGEKKYNYWSGYDSKYWEKWHSPKTPTKKAENVETREVFLTTTKKEREDIFAETLKNIEKYIDKKRDKLSKICLKWWDKNGKSYAHIYSIHTLPKTRKLFYTFVNQNYWFYKGIDSNINILAGAFVDFIEERFADKVNSVFLGEDSADFFADIFYEELVVFNKLMNQENTDDLDNVFYGYDGYDYGY